MGSSNDARKQERERSVFQSFAKICPLQIVDSSIESRCPPEPDIRCEIIGEGWVAFEMTSVEAEQYRRELAEERGNLDKTKDFRAEVAKYPELEKRYSGAGFFLEDSKLSMEKVRQLLAEDPQDREQLFLVGEVHRLHGAPTRIAVLFTLTPTLSRRERA